MIIYDLCNIAVLLVKKCKERRWVYYYNLKEGGKV